VNKESFDKSDSFACEESFGFLCSVQTADGAEFISFIFLLISVLKSLIPK